VAISHLSPRRGAFSFSLNLSTIQVPSSLKHIDKSCPLLGLSPFLLIFPSKGHGFESRRRRGICEQDTLKSTAWGSQDKQNCVISDHAARSWHPPIASQIDRSSIDHAFLQTTRPTPAGPVRWRVAPVGTSDHAARSWHPPLLHTRIYWSFMARFSRNESTGLVE
jgi:hypothetical protein